MILAIIIGVLISIAIIAFIGYICDYEGVIDLSNIFSKNKDQKEWKMFCIHKPPYSGWYLCTVEFGSRIPMLLYWDSPAGRFIDPIRKSVFDTYDVMITRKKEDNESIMPDEEYMEKLYTDDLVDRTRFVVAWKNEPRVYMGSIKNDRNTGINRADYSKWEVE